MPEDLGKVATCNQDCRLAEFANDRLFPPDRGSQLFEREVRDRCVVAGPTADAPGEGIYLAQPLSVLDIDVVRTHHEDVNVTVDSPIATCR